MSWYDHRITRPKRTGNTYVVSNVRNLADLIRPSRRNVEDVVFLLDGDVDLVGLREGGYLQIVSVLPSTGHPLQVGLEHGLDLLS